MYKSNKLSNIFNYEIELKDTLGNVKVLRENIRAQTQRSMKTLNWSVVCLKNNLCLCYSKMAAAVSNNELKIIDSNKNLIVKVCKRFLKENMIHNSFSHLANRKWYANKYDINSDIKQSS